MWHYPVHVDSITVSGLVRTRNEVVLRELLFRPGESVDSATVAESGRNLRRLLFLTDAEIRLTCPSDSSANRRENCDTARVEIHVRELYARALSPLAAGDLEEPSYGLVALDYNLFGAGQTGRLALYRDAVEGNSASLLYRVPRLAGSPVDVDTDLRWAEEGHRVHVGLSQPFRSLRSSWSHALSLSTVEETHRLYFTGGALASRYDERRHALAVRVTRSRGSAVKLRTGLALNLRDQAFHADVGPEYVPVDRRRVLPSAQILVWRPRYTRARYVHDLGRLEDLQTGSWLSLRLGASHKTLGSDRTYPFASLVLAPSLEPGLGSATYLFTYLAVSGRHTVGGRENAVAVAQIRLYSQLHGHHTAALRLRAEALGSMEDQTQFLLGVDTGLRGHLARSQSGSRRVIANLELRPLLWRGPHLSLAGAVFVDAGRAWSPHAGDEDTRFGGGCGLRLGLPQVYATPILRLDVARGYPDGVTQLVFGTGHYF